MKTISSQRFVDEEIVERKRAAGDYEVFVSPPFVFDGQTLRVILDGHHSLEAAKRDGVEPIFTEQTAMQNDNIGLLLAGKAEDFLNATHIDSDYYDVATGRDVW